MNKITWSIFAVFAVGIFALLIFLSKQSEIDLSKINISQVQSASKQNGKIGDHIYGNKSSKVILIEYADYQCAGCATVSPIVKSAVEAYKDDIQFIFRNFPLTSIHPNAKLAAASSEAAGLQGKYWEMHNNIYSTQDSWASLTGDERVDFFVNLAKELKLDTTKIKSDLASSAVSEKIVYDQALANKAGVNQTPTLYLNGKMLENDTLNTVDSLKAAIKKVVD